MFGSATSSVFFIQVVGRLGYVDNPGSLGFSWVWFGSLGVFRVGLFLVWQRVGVGNGFKV
jgi:hypothetical protein